MTTPARETILTALMTLLTPIASFVTVQRGYVDSGQFTEGARPAMCLVEKDDEYKSGVRGVITTTLNVDVWIYLWTKDNPNPSSVLNPLLDALDAVLLPTVVGPGGSNKQTLGGIVQNAYIDGRVIKIPGYIDGDGIIVAPVKILVP